MKTARDGLHDDFLLRLISDGRSSQTGAQFFRALVKNLSLALGTNGAWVTEYLPAVRRVRALAFWLGGEYVEHYEYDITGTPCEKMLRNKKYLHIPENIVDLFTGDPDLSRMGAVSYIGFPLVSANDEVSLKYSRKIVTGEISLSSPAIVFRCIILFL